MVQPVRCGLIAVLAAAMLAGQNPIPIPPGFGPRVPAQLPPGQNLSQPQAPRQTQPTTAPGQPQQPQQPGASPAPGPAPSGALAAMPTSTPTEYGLLSLQNASITEVIDLLARQLKINYVLDPGVKGGVILNTYGDTKQISPKDLLDTILRINNCAMVKVGDLYRIVPTSTMAHLPMRPERKIGADDIPDDDAPMLNLVFLKYATVEELSKVLKEFIGEGAQMIPYPPANLMFLLDSHRNMRRTMELISMFDNDMMANQRVRLFEMKNGRPSDIAKEMDSVMKSISLGGEKSSAVKFLPVDRINTIIAVASNPGAFDQVETWLKKLDIPVKSTGNATETYVYRLKYGRAECIAQSLMQLYGSIYMPYGMGMGMGGYGMGMGMGGYGGYGGFGGGGGYTNFSGGGTQGGSNAGLGVAGQCGGTSSGGMGMGMGMGMGGYGMGMGGMYPGGYTPQMGYTAGGAAGAGQTGAAGTQDMTGSYLGSRGQLDQAQNQMPRIVANPTNNSLLMHTTPNQYQAILRLLEQLDIPPRQILMEMKVYQVTLTGEFSSGVSYYLQRRGSGTAPFTDRRPVGSVLADTTKMTAGMLIGNTRELMGVLNLRDNAGRIKVISAPSLIATDSIPASITVGDEVPTSTGTATSNGTVLQSVSSRQTGVTMNVNARVNPSGVVTLIINQDYSQPGTTTSSNIDSPSFSNRSVQTQITMQDGDTVAIGGIISESVNTSTGGLPVLHKVPLLGYAFGSKSYSKQRSEMIVFITPHIIYDNADLIDASDELKNRIKMLKKMVRE